MKHRLKVRGQRKIYHDNINKKQNKKQPQVAILISQEDYRARAIIRDKKKHYIMIQGLISKHLTRECQNMR